MRIAIMSDSHDNIWNLEKALQQAQGADVLLFCGDLCAPFSLRMLADGFAGPIHAIQGNNDGDIALLLRVASESGRVRLYTDGLAELALGGRQIALTHYPHIAAAVAASGRYDAVFFGHTHKADHRRERNALLLNPGEVMGRFGKPSFAFYDTEAHDAAFVAL